MVFEVATFRIKDGQEIAFETAVQAAVPSFKRAQGCHSMKLERSIERASTYHLVVGWETVEHHMVTFRESEGFQEWRRLVGDFFAETPAVEHTETVVAGF